MNTSLFASRNINTLKSALLLSAALPLLVGCGRTVSVEDHLDPDGMQIRLFEDPPEDDQVHQPYAVGATIALTASSSDSGDRTCEWTMQSRNPKIFKLLEKEPCAVRFEAVGVGETTVDVYEPGSSDPVHHVNVKVRRPDRVELLDAADLEAHHPELAEDKAIHLIQGSSFRDASSVMFAVRAYDHDTRLYGTGIVTASIEGLNLVDKTTALESHEDWIGFYAANASTQAELRISVGGVPMQPISVFVHESEDVAEVQLVDDGDDHPEKNDERHVIALATDAEGNRIHGVGLRWWLDDEDQGGGDTFAYTYDPDTETELSVYRGEKRVAETFVKASDGSAYRAGNEVGSCSYAPGPGSSGWGWLLSVVGLGVIFGCRRRGARRER